MDTLKDIALLEEARQAVGTAESGEESAPIAGGWMTYDGVGGWGNQACGLGLQGPVSDQELDDLVHFYVSRTVEPRVEVCPFADESLIQGLGERGFRLHEFENVLVRKLRPDDDLRALHPHGWPADLEVISVQSDDDAMIDQFAEASTQGFREEGEELTPVLRRSIHRTVRHQRCHAFLARVAGTYVGGGSMEAAADIAGFFGVSVARAYRRRGIQTALLIHRMERARELGCSWASIHSGPNIGTERNCMRLGFFLAYTKAVLVMPGEGLTPSP